LRATPSLPGSAENLQEDAIHEVGRFDEISVALSKLSGEEEHAMDGVRVAARKLQASMDPRIVSIVFRFHLGHYAPDYLQIDEHLPVEQQSH
jgi:hypothetical protein